MTFLDENHILNISKSNKTQYYMSFIDMINFLKTKIEDRKEKWIKKCKLISS